MSLPEEGREGPKTFHPLASQKGHLSEVQRALVSSDPHIVTQAQKLGSTKASKVCTWCASVFSQREA